ncbi:DNA-processing protein DprA [Nocardia africana]|uniref:DNA protecting protein DprA n=1 Tax=Nocardia africana TaxID=134964 RepID=A0A378X1I9_9NOCA|nr:DNA-processing protein DprA [Nocardia africana]SUA47308.1 DNA protecting protein DprA [Nocardia africana]
MTDTITSDRLDRALVARALTHNARGTQLLCQSGTTGEIADRIRRGYAGFAIPSGLEEHARRDVDRLDELGVRLITRDDAEWPWPRLARLDRASHSGPFALYLRGPARLDALTERAITLTGSRAATGYGRTVTARIAAELTTLGWNVVAGSAYGVAVIAHKAALAVHGHPVAVLATGIDVAHPPGHSGLLDTIATSGLLVSEYPPGMSVTRARRRAQTRLLAALSRAVLIIEATSGGEPATIAAHAVRHRVPVFAVPGPVTSATTALPHELIATGRARLITSGHNIHHLLS